MGKLRLVYVNDKGEEVSFTGDTLAFGGGHLNFVQADGKSVPIPNWNHGVWWVEVNPGR